MFANERPDQLIQSLDPFFANAKIFLLKKNLFSNKNIDSCKKLINTKSIKNKNNNEIVITLTDKFFWCFYILKYGILKYDSIKSTEYSVSTNIKIQNIDFININRSLLKDHKMKCDNVLNKLMNNKKIDLECLKVLCIYNNINIIYLKNKWYYEMIFHDDCPISLITENNNQIHCKIIIEDNEKENIINNKFKVDNLDKPLKSISAYKQSELQDISTKFGIKYLHDNGKKKTKNELYGLIKKEML